MVDPKNLKTWAGGGRAHPAGKIGTGIDPKDDIFAAKNKLDNDEFIKARRVAEAKSKLADQSKEPADYRAAAAAHREAMLACVGGVKDKDRNKAHHKDEADAYKAKAVDADNPRTRDASGQVRPRLGEESKFSTNRGPRR